MFYFNVTVLVLNLYIMVSSIIHDDPLLVISGFIGSLMMLYQLTQGENK